MNISILYNSLPKDLARRITSAQMKVQQQQERIKRAEAKIHEETEEMKLFDQTPRLWVDQNYGPSMAIDAYAPVTRSCRIKEALATRIERRSVRALDYREATLGLEQTEREVLELLPKMKMRKGWVPWPTPLPPFEGYDVVLNVNQEVVALAKARVQKELIRAQERFADYNYDGAAVGDGSCASLAERRKGLYWSPVKHLGRLMLRSGATLGVSAWSDDNIHSMQKVIDQDQSGGTIGNLWDSACGFVLSGCDWIGFREWREELIPFVRHLHEEDGPSEAGRSQREVRLNRIARIDAFADVFANRYLPDDIVDLESFLNGSHALPSNLFKFWKEQGFNESIAKNWFLRAQIQKHVFHADLNDFGAETWNAMRNVGLAIEGIDIPLEQAISSFSLKHLKIALSQLELKSSHRIADCRSSLVSYSGRDEVLAILAQHGYLQLKAIKPPTGLKWEEFQSWRMQIRVMAGLLTDLTLDTVPMREREILFH